MCVHSSVDIYRNTLSYKTVTMKIDYLKFAQPISITLMGFPLLTLLSDGEKKVLLTVVIFLRELEKREREIEKYLNCHLYAHR